MCYVAPSTSETSDAGADADTVRGALVAVTSAGRVNVWGVPSLESVGEGQQEGEMGATVLDVPLLATHTVKVRCVRGLWFGWGVIGFRGFRVYVKGGTAALG